MIWFLKLAQIVFIGSHLTVGSEVLCPDQPSFADEELECTVVAFAPGPDGPLALVRRVD